MQKVAGVAYGLQKRLHFSAFLKPETLDITAFEGGATTTDTPAASETGTTEAETKIDAAPTFMSVLMTIINALVSLFKAIIALF